MSLSAPREIYGIHSVVPINRTTKLPYGILRVLEGGVVELTADKVDLFGGSNPYPWASEPGDINAEFSFTCSEYPDFLFQLFLGGTASAVTTDTDGSVTSITAISGTTVPKADTGLASIALRANEGAYLKYGRYIAVAINATTVDIYMQQTVDVTRGVSLSSVITDALKITASPLTVSNSSATTEIPYTGLNLVGGSGTVAMTAGHAGYFDVFPPHTGRSTISVGATGSTFPEFAARLCAKKSSDGKVSEVHAFKCNGSGMQIGFTRNEFSAPELSLKMLYDSSEDKVFEFITVDEDI